VIARRRRPLTAFSATSLADSSRFRLSRTGLSSVSWVLIPLSLFGLCFAAIVPFGIEWIFVDKTESNRTGSRIEGYHASSAGLAQKVFSVFAIETDARSELAFRCTNLNRQHHELLRMWIRISSEGSDK
jgi:hypothetical protein